MTPQNEPMTGFFPNYPFNTMGFTAEMERDFIKTDLGPTLEKGGWTPDNFTIMIFDHNREWLPDYAETILNDTHAAKYVKGIAFHWYDKVPDFPKRLDQTHQKLNDYFMLSTEACVGGIPKIGSWDDGERYAADIIMDLKHWSTGWVDWNMVLDMKGGPSWINSSLGAPIIVNKDKNEYYKNPTLYAIGHFSKFLSPESRRIGTSINKLDEDGFYTVVFKRPDHGIVVVVINNKNHSQILALDDQQVGQLTMQIQPKSFNSLIYYTNK